MPRVDLTCPYPLRLHRELDAIEDRAAAWLCDVGLATTATDTGPVVRYRAGWYAAAGWPDGDRDLVDLAADFTHWVLVFDDLTDTVTGQRDQWTTMRRLAAAKLILADPDADLPDLGPVMQTWRGLARRLRRLLDPQTRLLFEHAFAELLMQFTYSMTGHAVDVAPSLAEYTAIRPLGGMHTNFCLLLPGSGMPPAAWCDPAVRALVHCATSILAFTNDLISADREQAEQQPTNLPSLMAAHHQVDPAAGMALAVTHVRALYRRLDELAGDLRQARPDTAVFVDRVQTHLAGHHHWAELSGRYSIENR